MGGILCSGDGGSLSRNSLPGRRWYSWILGSLVALGPWVLWALGVGQIGYSVALTGYGVVMDSSMEADPRRRSYPFYPFN